MSARSARTAFSVWRSLFSVHISRSTILRISWPVRIFSRSSIRFISRSGIGSFCHLCGSISGGISGFLPASADHKGPCKKHAEECLFFHENQILSGMKYIKKYTN